MWKFSAKKMREVFNRVPVMEITKKTGYAKQTVYGWKNGSFTPSLPAVTKLCNTFDVNPATLFDHDGVESIKNPLIAGGGSPEEMEKGTQYFFETEGHVFSITPLGSGFIELTTYEVDEEVYGYRVRERIKIKVER